MTPFVFISHANPDKPAIRHIVDALITAGIKVWLDNPAAMGYTAPEVRAHFFRLSADKRWQDEIDDALVAASAVIVCFSKRFDEARRQKWRDEAAIARAGKKLIACRIDDLDPTSLVNSYAEQQIPDVRRDRVAAELATTLVLLIDDVRRKMAQRVEDRFRQASERDRPRNWFTPYPVDRTRQEDAMGAALETIAAEGGVRAFFVAGPENEGVDEFIERLERFSCIERLGLSWQQVVVDWPNGVGHTDAAASFRRRLTKELKLSAAATEDHIVKALARYPKPVAVLSRMRAESWRGDECMTVRAWLGLWEGLDAAARKAGLKMAVMPILCLKMPPAKPGWRGVPRGRAPGAKLSNAEIWANVCAIREPGFFMSWFHPPVTKPEFKAPPVLHPVPRFDVDAWLQRDMVRDQLGGAAVVEAQSLITRLYRHARANADGVPIKDFVTSLEPLFGKRT